MVGIRKFSVYSKRIRYNITIRRNVTIINGDSGTGKTNFYNMVMQLVGEDDGEQTEYSGIHSDAKDSLLVLTKNKHSINRVKNSKNKIVVVDESCSFIFTDMFAEMVNSGNNYFIIITRKKLTRIAYSIREIYSINSTIENGVTVNELEQKYREDKCIFNNENKKYEVIVTEDSNSGNQAVALIVGDKRAIAAGGNGNVYNKLVEMANTYSDILVIVDGAAFGSCICKVEKFCKEHKINIIAYESFEYILLKSEYFRDYVEKQLEKPYDYCDSRKYLSWERFFNSLLEAVCVDKFGFVYTKKKLAAELKKEWMVRYLIEAYDIEV